MEDESIPEENDDPINLDDDLYCTLLIQFELDVLLTMYKCISTLVMINLVQCCMFEIYVCST